MLKYGNTINITSFTNNTRNLTFNQNKLITSNTDNISTNNTTNNENLNVTDLYINTLNVVLNSYNPYIIISSPIAFSFLKSSYQSNNFNLYPIYFSENIYIENDTIILKSSNVIIKDNIILINSELNNININNYLKNDIISGYVFPIADKNSETGYYSGLLYFPNNKLELLNINSSLYKWVSSQYNYFKNNNKGFFKLNYIPSTIDLTNNNIDINYYNLINNNDNLSNLQINSIGLYDGEIVGLSNNLFFNLSDGNNIYKLLSLSNTLINIYNNLSIEFVNELIIQDNSIKYINFTNSEIIFYQNILLNKNIFTIKSLYDTILYIDTSLNIIQISSTTTINILKVLVNFELNNIPIKFVNNLNIESTINNEIFITFNSLPNTITFLQPTYINNLFINNKIELLNNIPLIFNENLYIQDKLSNNYIYFNSNSNQITFLASTYLNYIYINSLFNLLNNIPIIISDYLIIRNNDKNLIKFDTNNTILYTSLFLKYANINFNYNETLNISDISNSINLLIDSTITIKGPNNIINTIVNSSFNITNTVTNYSNITFIPYYKTYITSGITQSNENIYFIFLNVISTNNMSGKLIGTSYTINNTFINSYEINLWTYPNNDSTITLINYNTLNQYNTNNIGNWNINNILLIKTDNTYNLKVECNGSTSDIVIWSFKLDILQI
jgi:hypothetical protein